MRIACLVLNNLYNGAENMVVLAAKHLTERHDVWYCSPSGPINKYLDDAGVAHVPIKKVNVKTVKNLMKTFEPDVFLVLDNKASVVCALAKVPFISYQQNNWPWIGGFNPFSLGMLYYSKRAKKVIGVSDHLINEFRFSKSIRDKYITIPNVVDLSHVKELAGDLAETKIYDMCTIGRMAPQKSPSTFVRIVSKLAKTRPDISAVMIGDGELMGEVKALTEQLGVKDNITFTGFLKNPFEIMKQSKLLVMTSLYEGKSLAVIEAMSLGLPVITSRVPGMEDDIDDSCGRICDNEEEFCAAIEEFLSDEKLYQTMSQGAKIRAQMSGDVEKYIADMEKICHEALG